jgi:parvulin-like peptidyl-prolyl isomerase
MADQVRASHILLMYRGSSRSTATRSKEEAQKEISVIADELAKGGDFSQIAQDRSDCPSGRDGGDLGFFRRGQMVKEFEETAFGLTVGATSGVVETAFGYHIIQRTG